MQWEEGCLGWCGLAAPRSPAAVWTAVPGWVPADARPVPEAGHRPLPAPDTPPTSHVFPGRIGATACARVPRVTASLPCRRGASLLDRRPTQGEQVQAGRP